MTKTEFTQRCILNFIRSRPSPTGTPCVLAFDAVQVAFRAQQELLRYPELMADEPSPLSRDLERLPQINASLREAVAKAAGVSDELRGQIQELERVNGSLLRQATSMSKQLEVANGARAKAERAGSDMTRILAYVLASLSDHTSPITEEARAEVDKRSWEIIPLHITPTIITGYRLNFRNDENVPAKPAEPSPEN